MYRRLIEKSWTDEEPDTLHISVETDGETGAPYLVFTGSCTWLTEKVVDNEVTPWLGVCTALIRQIMHAGCCPACIDIDPHLLSLIPHEPETCPADCHAVKGI